MTTNESTIAWRDLVFDLENPKDREEHKFHEPGVDLPITHQNSPVLHGVLCGLLRDGTLADEKYPYVAAVRKPLNGDTRTIDYSLLDDFCSMASTLTRSLKSEPPKPPKQPPRKRGR